MEVKTRDMMHSSADISKSIQDANPDWTDHDVSIYMRGYFDSMLDSSARQERQRTDRRNADLEKKRQDGLAEVKSYAMAAMAIVDKGKYDEKH